MGDGILADFGYPKAHEDDAERAVRAGLDVVAKIGQLLLPSDEPLQVRVGIASGVVVLDTTIGEGLSEQQVAVGETPNLAAPLQSLARPNTVLVASSTRRLLGGVFVCDDLGPREIKGITHPVLTHRILGERVVENYLMNSGDGKLTQFVGRQRELQELLGLWKRANDGKGQIALLCGEPGIGKSRISNVVEEQHCRGPAHYDPIPVLSASHQQPLLPGHPPTRACGALRAHGYAGSKTRQAGSPPVQGRANDSVRCRTLCRFAIDSDERTLSGVGPRSATTEGPYDRCADPPAFESCAHPAGAFLKFEDVHWIDPTTLELINRMIQLLKAVPYSSL